MRRAMNTDNNEKAAEDREALIRKQEHIINQQKRKLASQEKEIESLRQMYEKKATTLKLSPILLFGKLRGRRVSHWMPRRVFTGIPGKGN